MRGSEKPKHLGRKKRRQIDAHETAVCTNKDSSNYKRGNSKELLVEDLIDKSIPESNEAISPHIKDIALVLRKINKIKFTPGHILVKLKNIGDKQRTLELSERNGLLPTKEHLEKPTSQSILEVNGAKPSKCWKSIC
jgi:hypothetical protein